MIIKCKMCGGDLRPAENATTCECEYCGSVNTLPKLDNERRLNMYDRANHFRRNNEYDKAMGIFEQILQDDRTDAEAYWSLVLCRYGIEYVEDPATKKRIPTVNRAQFTSIFADEDYKSAIEYADSVQKGVYAEEAKAIDTIQKGILDISKKEKPFDVFICYKETDANGKRTPDSVLANDLYHQLTREGFKVFFSRITLEDKLGQQYEPYIFAALNSAKVMVVLGTKPEHFNAVWVKNEWNRYLALIKAGANKTLVPAYKDMDPYDLPDEFSHLQAQDMSKLGFMQDLIHGIKKLAGEEKPSAAQQPIVVQAAAGSGGTNAAALLDRAFMALEDGEFTKADDFCEKALNIDARNARAYVGKLMAELKIHKESDLQYQPQPIERSGNYAKALRFADEKLKVQLTKANEAIQIRNEQRRLQDEYNTLLNSLNSACSVADVRAIRSRISALASFKDAATGLKACDNKIETINSTAYTSANALMKQGRYADAAAAFRAIGDYRDCEAIAAKCDELEKQRLAEEAAARAEQTKREAERRAKEEAERKEKERIAAELKRQQETIARREAEAKAEKAKKTGIMAVIAAAICVAAFFVVIKVVLPKLNYDNAVKAMEAGQYDAAITAFTELGDYKDCDYRILQAQANKAFAAEQYDTVVDYYTTLPAAYQDHADDFVTLYNDAVALMDGGSYDDAIAAFTKLGNYSDSKNLIAQMNADIQFEAGNYAAAYDAYATLDATYQTHADDYATMYTAAETARTSGDYDSAYDQFIALGNYSDARDKANDSAYKYAAQLAAQGEYWQAANAWWTIRDYQDSEEQHYQMGLQAYAEDKLADARAILSANPEYRDSKETLYQIGVRASAETLYSVSIPAFTQVGAYKDAPMKLTIDTYAWGGQLYDDGEYDRSAEVFASMGEFSDAPTRVNEARYAAAGAAMANGSYDDAFARYTAIAGYSDSADKAKAAAYAAASELLGAGEYADAKARFQTLGNYSDSKAKVQECDYVPSKALYDAKQYADALAAFTDHDLAGYKDTDTLMNDCRYNIGKKQMAEGAYNTAVAWFDAAGDYSDAKTQADACRYQLALALMDADSYDEAITAFTAIAEYSDSAAQISACYNAKATLLEADGSYEAAYAQYELAGNTAKMQETAYQTALAKLSGSDYESAIAWYDKAGTYSDAREQILSIGEYYYTTQQYDLAEAVYVKVLGTGNAAQRLYELGQYYELAGNIEHAAQAYREAGDYQDAQKKVNEFDYQTACSQMLAGDYEGARLTFARISGYKDVGSKLAECDNAIAAAALDAKFSVGNYVTFGTYPQTSSGTDSTPIEWLVIARDGPKALLISRYALDAQPYNTRCVDMTWEKCSLRKWLNGTFMNKAFSRTEQSAILLTNVDNSSSQVYVDWWVKSDSNNTQDKIFLLSFAEAWRYCNAKYDMYYSSKYGENTKPRVEPTAYAIKNGALTDSDCKTVDGKAAGWWWLRSPGYNQRCAAQVCPSGALNCDDVDNTLSSVRPALWVNLDSGIF